MILAVVLLLVGFVLLVKGADFFVDGSSGIAKLLKIPSIVIGLTIVAFGTSAPEAAVSIIAGVNGSNEIAISNVIGSNIFNLLGVLGITALIKPVRVGGEIVKKQFPFLLAATMVLLLFSYDYFFGNGADVITRGEAFTLIILMGIFMYSVVTFALSSRNNNTAEEQPDKGKPVVLWKSILFSVLGLGGIILGGQLVVDSATKIAVGFGMSQTLVGLTIVAVGTSLPELVTSIVAAKKGESDLAVGNVVGSNVFNILFVLGASAAITPMSVNGLAQVDLLILMGVTTLAYLFSATGKVVNRVEGGLLTLCYVGYMVYAIIR